MKAHLPAGRTRQRRRPRHRSSCHHTPGRTAPAAAHTHDLPGMKLHLGCEQLSGSTSCLLCKPGTAGLVSTALNTPQAPHTRGCRSHSSTGCLSGPRSSSSRCSRGRWSIRREEHRRADTEMHQLLPTMCNLVPCLSCRPNATRSGRQEGTGIGLTSRTASASAARPGPVLCPCAAGCCPAAGGKQQHRASAGAEAQHADATRCGGSSEVVTMVV